MNKITQQIAQNIINEYVTGASSYELADKYHLWQTSICNLIAGRSWKDCVRPQNMKEIIQSRKQKGLDIGRSCQELPHLSPLQEDILVGSMLGDGSLSHSSLNSCFSKNQKYDRKEYLDWHAEMLDGYSANVRPIYSKEKLTEGFDGKIQREKTDEYLSGYRYETFNHPNLTDLRNKWYKNNIKIIPADLGLNPQRIAIWYFDDGSNDSKQRVAVLCTQSFTLDESEFLVEKFQAFNLYPTIKKIKSKYTGRQMPILKFSRSSYDNIIALVKPYMLWDCFAHKVEWHRAKKQWESSGKFTEKQAKEIIEMRKTKNAKEIAKIFDVHVNTIYAMVSGRSWGHLQNIG